MDVQQTSWIFLFLTFRLIQCILFFLLLCVESYTTWTTWKVLIEVWQSLIDGRQIISLIFWACGVARFSLPNSWKHFMSLSLAIRMLSEEDNNLLNGKIVKTKLKFGLILFTDPLFLLISCIKISMLGSFIYNYSQHKETYLIRIN